MRIKVWKVRDAFFFYYYYYYYSFINQIYTIDMYSSCVPPQYPGQFISNKNLEN